MPDFNLTHHFLIAMPSLADPHFVRGVTLICQHDENGAMGLVINHPSEFTLAEVLRKQGRSDEALGLLRNVVVTRKRLLGAEHPGTADAWYNLGVNLKAAGQNYWQILPLNHTTPKTGSSPYNCLSAFAGNPLLVSLETLARDGLLDMRDLEDAPGSPEDSVDYGAVIRWKLPLLEKAHAKVHDRFCALGPLVRSASASAASSTSPRTGTTASSGCASASGSRRAESSVVQVAPVTPGPS